jgi:lysophospholipase L1-like esterase
MRFVAIGDSFTEGVGDELPDGTVRGWADLVAAGLSAALAADGETVEYANLAIRGRLLRPIVTTQLDAALALRPAPDLLTLNGGGNDMMRPGVDLASLIALTEQTIQRCADAGVRLVLISGPDPSAQLPFGRTFRRRGAYLTAALAEICARRDITFVDCFGDAEVRDHRYWSPDRLHLNSDGHRRVAGLILHALGFGPVPEPAPVVSAARRSAAANARYYREHVLPWMQRRLRGRSSGDNRDPKHPVWHLVKPGTETSLS